MTVEILLFSGFVAGLVVGIAIGNARIGWLILAAVPVAMIVYVAWWQGENPDKLRSTSGLDFIFGPLWPSRGALSGHFAGNWVRGYFGKR